MISLEEVYKAAKKKERENLRSRSFLKNHADDGELYRQFLPFITNCPADMIVDSAPTAAVRIVSTVNDEGI